jgi:fatty acid desaturase
MKCRTCGSVNVHRSRLRHSRERIVTMLTTWRYYRCHDCNDRMALRRAPELKKPRMSGKRRMRMVVKYAKIVAVVLALLAGLYVVASPYFQLQRPVPRQKR